MSFRSIAFHGLRSIERLAESLPSCGRFDPVRGSFSAFKRLESGQLPGKVLFHKQETGPCEHGSITMLCNMRQHDHQPWPAFWTLAEKERLTGSLLQWRDHENRICAEGCFNHPQRHSIRQERLLANLFIPPPLDLDGAWTSLVSSWGNGSNYFHWLTDSLPRLRIREQLPEPTRVLIPNTHARYIRESLKLLGIEDECEPAKALNVRPERYYFCSPLAMTGVWNPEGFDWLRERFAKYFLPPSSGKPVFLSRRSSTRIPDQLPEIEALFVKAGFEIVDCGTLGFLEQIESISAAPAIAGLHGAAMTNILWAAKGTPVLELFQPNYLNGCYEQIAFHGELDYTANVITNDQPLKGTEEWLLDHSL